MGAKTETTSAARLSGWLGENEEAREFEETVEVARLVISEKDKLSRRRGVIRGDR